MHVYQMPFQESTDIVKEGCEFVRYIAIGLHFLLQIETFGISFSLLLLQIFSAIVFLWMMNDFVLRDIIFQKTAVQMINYLSQAVNTADEI